MIEVHTLTSVVVTVLGLAFLFVVWSDQIYAEIGVSERYEQVLDVILTALIVFALCDVLGVL